MGKSKTKSNEPVNEAGRTLGEFLAAYDENKYRRPSVTADIAVFSLFKTQEDYALCLLLIRRRNHPDIGMWALPGGFVDMEEELDRAAERELQEETGISGLPVRQFGAFGKVDRDPRTRVITVGYFAVAPYGSLEPKAGDDAADAALFRVTLKRSAFTAAATLYDLTLTGPETLTARISCTEGALGEAAAPLPKSMLASDHAHLIYCALRELEVQPKRIAGLLAGESGHLIRPALRALKEALDVRSPACGAGAKRRP
ncbi:MAG TPA: NUDIX hydrolase [Feifaniaceae bacterium]|nr:NUDIX hydrolase [Feifaniaceae bacterium]